MYYLLHLNNLYTYINSAALFHAFLNIIVNSRHIFWKRPWFSW